MNTSFRYLLIRLSCCLVFFACGEEEKKVVEVLKVQTQTQQAVTSKMLNNTLARQDGLNGKVKRMSKTTFHAKKKGGQILKVMPGNRYVTLYDTNGHGMERRYYNSAMQLQTNMKYSIDQKNSCTSSKLFNATGTLINNITYTYDQLKNVKEELRNKSNGKQDSKKDFTYYKNGLLAQEIIYDGANQFDMRISYQYNKAGNLIVSNYYRPSNVMIVHCQISYGQFDKNNNWIKSVEKTNKGGLFIVEREIEYYE